MAQITKDMLISDIIAIDRNTIPILMEAGMNCAGCPMAQKESLQEACQSHGEDVDALVVKLNSIVGA